MMASRIPARRMRLTSRMYPSTNGAISSREIFSGVLMSLCSFLYRLYNSVVKSIPMLLVHALSQRASIVVDRFETTKDPGSIQTAVDDYVNAAQETDKLSSSYRSLFEVRKGVVDAYVARDQTEFLNAIRLISQGAKQIGSSTDDVRIVARLDYERSMLN